MRLALQSVDIDQIRTDGGTQVRESLNEEWIRELASLYEDGGHDIDPPLVMVDPDGNHWLVDGFHRVEAMRRAGHQGTLVRVREGSLDMAKLAAAQMNKNGLQRTAGDKKRAILLALSTTEGKKMGVRELARHCGVSVSHTQRVVSGDDVSPGGQCSPSTSTPDLPKTHKREVAMLWARVDAALRANPSRLSTDIAREVGCHEAVVRGRRDALGLPRITKAEASRSRHCATRDRAAELLAEHPDWSNAKISEESGAAPTTVAKVRERTGLPPSDKRGQRAVEAEPTRAKQTASTPTPATPPRLRIVEAPAAQRAEDSAQFRRLLTEALALPEEMRRKLIAKLEESLAAEAAS